MGEEWIGGYVRLPLYVSDGGKALRPTSAVWLAGDGCIVGLEYVPPGSPPSALARLLEQAMREPVAGSGPPRKPSRIRVSDPAVVESVREAVGPGTEIVVAPAPELEEVKRRFPEFVMEEQPIEESVERSYLSSGLVEPALVEAFFRAAAELWRAAPWRHAAAAQPLRLSVPALGLPRACVSILGAAGKIHCLLVFDSLEHFLRHVAAVEAAPTDSGDDWRIDDLGTEVFTVTFAPEGALTRAMRREVKAHGWKVPDHRAHPYVIRADRDAVPRPVSPEDYRLAIVAATAVARFAGAHPEAFARPLPDTVSLALEVTVLGAAIPVTVALPYEPPAR